MTIGNILRKNADEYKKSKIYERLKSKHYLSDKVKLIDSLLENSKKGSVSVSYSAYDLLNEKYHPIINMDMRSKEKKILVSEVTEYLQLKLEDVTVSWVGKSEINFAWW